MTKKNTACEWCLHALATKRVESIRRKNRDGGPLRIWMAVCDECFNSNDLIIGKYHSLSDEKRADKFCPKGHALTKENIYLHEDREYCRTCRTERMRLWRLANKEKARKQTREAARRFYKRKRGG